MNNNYFYNQHMFQSSSPKVNVTISHFSDNRFVYVNQNTFSEQPKVLINPHFKKTVYINPNFSKINTSNKIHVNPNVKSIHVNPKIHVNPSVLKSILPNNTNQAEKIQPKENIPAETVNRTIVSTRTKLIRVPEEKLKIGSGRVKRNSIRTKYKIVKSNTSDSVQTRNVIPFSKRNIYKLDNTKLNISISSNKTSKGRKKYVYINRFPSISEIAKNALLKPGLKQRNMRLVNISGVMYKKSPNSLKKMSQVVKKVPNLKSKYKLVKKLSKAQLNKSKVLQKSIIKRSTKNKSKKVSLAELKKCNLPCPVYRRYGVCKAYTKGICFRKHDPDQIILCTKFLQGACLKKNCLLSHNVSPEKMPTCKYYLEGLCSKDDCPYLHVKISPKADICRDFLEGFCKKAAACEKRHQLLCPEYERNGSCPKKVCPYPHGNLVRINTIFRKFAKKCSDNNKNKAVIKIKPVIENVETNEKCSRYYIDGKSTPVGVDKIQIDDTNCDEETFFKIRPKLGQLPAFIPLFEDK